MKLAAEAAAVATAMVISLISGRMDIKTQCRQFGFSNLENKLAQPM
jgi:hypothetical protein